MFGKLTVNAIPWDQPIPLIAGAAVGLALIARLRLGGRQGSPALSLARMDHERRPQTHRRHVCPARAGHAAAWFHRRGDDAVAAGRRLSRAGLSAAASLQPDLFRPRHDHDLLRGDADHDRPHEFRRPAAARRARRGLPDAELRRVSGSPRLARCSSTSRWSSANSRRRGGCPIRRSPSFPIRQESASTIIFGRC